MDNHFGWACGLWGLWMLCGCRGYCGFCCSDFDYVLVLKNSGGEVLLYELWHGICQKSELVINQTLTDFSTHKPVQKRSEGEWLLCFE